MRNDSETEFRSGNVLLELTDEQSQLPGAERLIAAEILRDPTASLRISVAELAERAGASPASAVRLARRLGRPGYAALKLDVAAAVGRADQLGRPREVDGDHPLDALLAEHRHALEALRTSIDRSTFDEIAGSIARCDHLMITGAGGSNALAQLAAFRFLALGIDSAAPADHLTARLRASLLRRNDVCLAISHVGETIDTIQIVETSREAGALTVGVTSYARSTLADACDAALVTGWGAPPATLELLADRVTHLAVLSALHTAVSAQLESNGQAARAIVTRQS
jgi:DNA-binding MurR/RpiR family transcriptional regulator